MAKQVTAVTKALGRLTQAAQAEVIPLLEAILIDTLVIVAADKTMTDSQKAGAVDFGSRSIESVRLLVMQMLSKQPAGPKPVVYGPPPSPPNQH